MCKSTKKKKEKRKLIGSEVIGTKENIYKIMLQLITKHTIADSTCNILYKNKDG